ncbi:MAG TPA: glycosyltransferase family 4 protein [Flavobacterium sp.]
MAIKPKLIRITTVPISLDKLLSGQMRFMSQHYDVTAISSDKEALGKVGRKEGVPVYEVAMTRKITPVADLKSVLKLYSYFKKEKPQIVHTHTPKAGIVGMLAAKLAGVPHRLHTVAGLPLLEATGNKRKLLDFVEKMTYSCATKVYPNSYGLLEIIRQNDYCPASKLAVLGNGSSNGIDTEFFSPTHFTINHNSELRESYGISTTDVVYIFVGRLVADKGLNELTAAFDRLSKEQENLKLLLVGNFEDELDPLSSDTMKVVNSNKSIILAGYQNDVRPYFAISDVLAFPSYREGFPNVVMQAGAMGLPAIVSDINGCNEIISEDINGVIVAPKDTETLYIALKKLADGQIRSKLGTNARQMIESRYSQKVIWNALLNEYKSLVNAG